MPPRQPSRAPNPTPGNQPEATSASLGRTLGRTDLAKGQEGRRAAEATSLPGWLPPAGAGGQGSLASCRRPHTRAHTHPLRARGRAHSRALTRRATKPRVVEPREPSAPMGGGAVATRAGGHPTARAFTCYVQLQLRSPQSLGASLAQASPGHGQEAMSVALRSLGGGKESWGATAAQSRLPGLCEQAGGRERSLGASLLSSPSAFWLFLPHPRCTNQQLPAPRPRRLSPAAPLTCVTPPAPLTPEVPSPSHSLNFPSCCGWGVADEGSLSLPFSTFLVLSPNPPHRTHPPRLPLPPPALTPAPSRLHSFG